MLVVSEAGKIRKKKEEEERRALMAAGFEKLKAAVDEKVAARAAVQKVNEGLKAVSGDVDTRRCKIRGIGALK